MKLIGTKVWWSLDKLRTCYGTIVDVYHFKSKTYKSTNINKAFLIKTRNGDHVLKLLHQFNMLTEQ